MRSLLLAFLLFGFASLGYAGTYEGSIDVSFPDELAGLTFSERTEFPQKELGVRIGYQGSGPVLGSVYIYNAGSNSIPAGTAAPIVRKHFAQVIAEVKQLERAGQARAVNLSETANQITTYNGCGPQFLWRAYEIDFPEATLASYTYLTAMKNQFVKLRVSHRKGDVQGARDAERFVQQIRKVLGGCQ